MARWPPFDAIHTGSTVAMSTVRRVATADGPPGVSLKRRAS
jgi:hypothetical protein